MKPHQRHGSHVFHNLTTKDINKYLFSDVLFDPQSVLKFGGV